MGGRLFSWRGGSAVTCLLLARRVNLHSVNYSPGGRGYLCNIIIRKNEGNSLIYNRIMRINIFLYIL